MSSNNMYQRHLLEAIEAFLEETSSARIQAHHIIQHCYAVMMGSETKRVTLDGIIWSFFFQALTDSVYYEDKTFLRETREILLGHAARKTARIVLSLDYRAYFTANEVQWYDQLLSMVNFIAAIPFAEIREAIYQARQDTETWTIRKTSIPEVAQAEKIDQEYLQRQALIEDISATSPSPENIGDETIYHLVLREVTCLLMETSVGQRAAYQGYPMFAPHFVGSYASNREGSSTFEPYDMTGNLLWAKRLLEAISGKGELFISWRLSKVPMSDTGMLHISLY